MPTVVKEVNGVRQWEPLKHESRRQYKRDGEIIRAFCFKCGTKTTHALTHGEEILFQPQVVAERDERTVLYHVRHPVDRLVSCWRWFTTVKTNFISRDLVHNHPKDHEYLMSGRDFEKWCEIAWQHWNPHWYPQAEYHTTAEGLFVPTLVKTLDFMGPVRKNTTAPVKKSSVMSKKFRQRIEDLYENDMVLYELAKEAGRDGIDTRATSVFRPTRRDVWHRGLEETD